MDWMPIITLLLGGIGGLISLLLSVLVRRIGRIEKELKDMYRHLDATFQRRDMAVIEHEALGRDIQTAHKRIDQLKQART